MHTEEGNAEETYHEERVHRLSDVMTKCASMAKVAVALSSPADPAPPSPPSPGDFIVDEPAPQVAFRSRIEVSRPLSAPEPGYSSGSTEQSCTDGRPLSARSPSRFQLNTQSERSSPARFKVYPQSELCGSSPASGSMELEYEIFPNVSMDLRRRLLLSLYNIKFTMSGDDQWRATDPSVLTKLQRLLQNVEPDLSIDKIKEHVIAMEDDVKLDMGQVKKNSEDRDTYFLVFDYVTPEFVQDTPTDIIANEPYYEEVFTPNKKKIKMICNPDYTTNSCRSDPSIGEHFSMLMEDKDIAKEFFNGPMSMENCTDKVMRCGFKGNELHRVLKLLKSDWEHRQIFMKLGDSEAKDWVLYAIYGSVPPPA